MTDLDKIIISIAIECSRAEGLTEDEEVADRANVIATDATLDSPNTKEGQQVREKALQAVKDQENGIESPYFPKKKYDMNALYDKTANASIKPIFEVIAKYACSQLGRPMVAATEESDKVLLKINDDMSLEVFKVLNDNNVPLVWISNVMQDLKAIIGDLDTLMKKQVVGHTKEILSRAVGIRHPNPEDNAFNDNFATYADLLKAREKMIELTGGKAEDYKQDYRDAIE